MPEVARQVTASWVSLPFNGLHCWQRSVFSLEELSSANFVLPYHLIIMKNIKYLMLGVIFGLALTKGEAISWFRIQEMFHFESFHMYGIFMTAVPLRALSLFLIKENESSFNGW